MIKKLPEVELTISEDKDGAFAISLVDRPATQENFIYLSESIVQLSVTSEDKQEVIGLVLIPEQRIYRNIQGKEFNIWMSENTVYQTAHKYMVSLNLNNVTVQHETEVPDVSVVESWIVDDPKKDKTAIYNLNATKGAWAVKMKINNPEVWQGVKDGKYNGYSIEALYSGLDKVLASTQESKEDLVLAELEQIIQNQK